MTKQHTMTIGAALVAALLGTSAPATAQTMQTISSPMTADSVSYELVAKAISPNHRYVVGQANNYDMFKYGAFIYDMETAQLTFINQTGFMGNNLSAVNNDGTAVGYDASAMTVSADGTVTALPAPDGFMGQAFDMSDNGTVIVGQCLDNMTFEASAAVWVNGAYTALPVPTEAEVGHQLYGSEARWVSSDGAVIVGKLIDNISSGSLIVWRLQADGTYAADPISASYVSTDGATEGHPYKQFTPSGISSNGKYIALTLTKADNRQYVGRYDLENASLEECLPDGTGAIADDAVLESGAIADNGTMIVTMFTGSVMLQKSSACLWTVGAKEPALVASMGEGLADMAALDATGGNYMMDITPDASHLVGYAYDTNMAYISYVVDLNADATTISSVPSTADNAIMAAYDMAGRRVNVAIKGLKIVRRANGTTFKVVGK